MNNGKISLDDLHDDIEEVLGKHLRRAGISFDYPAKDGVGLAFVDIMSAIDNALFAKVPNEWWEEE